MVNPVNPVTIANETAKRLKGSIRQDDCTITDPDRVGRIFRRTVLALVTDAATRLACRFAVTDTVVLIFF